MGINGVETPIGGHEACKIIGCCYEHLLKECKSGKVPHFKIGNRYWFRASTLERWLTEQEQVNIHPKTVGLGRGSNVSN